MYNNRQVDIMVITNIIDSMVKEYALVIANEKSKVLNRVEEPKSWQPPPTCIVKLNVDAVVTDDLAALVVVARDSSGEVLKVQTKLHELCSPLQVEPSHRLVKS